MAINYQKLFGDLGLLIRTANAYRVSFTNTIDSESARKAAEQANGRYEEAGDNSGQLSNWRLIGAVKGSNTDSEGLLHVNLTASGGTATLSLYKNSAKQSGDLVAQGSAPSTGTVSVILAAQNGSGLSGTVTLAYSTDDTNITLIPPFRTTAHNDIFEKMARTDGSHRQTLSTWQKAEVANAREYITTIVKDEMPSTFTAAEDIIADLGSKMQAASQSVDANTVSATTPVAGPGNTGGGTMSSVTVSQMAKTQSFRVQCVNAGSAGSETWEVHASEDGLLPDRATTGVAYTSYLGGVSFTISAGTPAFAVGDKFTFNTTSSGEGTIQTFFRDNFAVSLPSNAAGAETISDSLAE